MRKTILLALAMQLPCKVIHENKRPYLERYHLFNALRLKFYLHRFVASDPDRGLHDHPWPWAFSVILFNKYRELLRGKSRIVRWFNFISGDRFHRVIIEEGEEVWSLFIHPNNYNKEWGFLRPDPNGVKIYYPHTSKHRKEGETVNNWEVNAPKGKDLLRDERKIAIV